MVKITGFYVGNKSKLVGKYAPMMMVVVPTPMLPIAPMLLPSASPKVISYVVQLALKIFGM